VRHLIKARAQCQSNINYYDFLFKILTSNIFIEAKILQKNFCFFIGNNDYLVVGISLHLVVYEGDLLSLRIFQS